MDRMLVELIFLLLINLAMGTNAPLFDEEEKRLYNFGLGKRAYSYVSEYKRLPVYNFGLGKRSEGRTTQFFGLGKQNENSDSDLKNDQYYSSMFNKRGKNYDFDLGKRLPSTDYPGKKTSQFSFGLGKRLGHYNFGLGKRQGKYSFGLGKKDKVYSFGLGKRQIYIPSHEEDVSDYEDALEEEKRSQKYAFGLGKRDNIFENTEDQDNQLEQDSGEFHYSFDLDRTNANFNLPIKSLGVSEFKESSRDNKKYEQ